MTKQIEIQFPPTEKDLSTTTVASTGEFVSDRYYVGDPHPDLLDPDRYLTPRLYGPGQAEVHLPCEQYVQPPAIPTYQLKTGNIDLNPYLNAIQLPVITLRPTGGVSEESTLIIMLSPRSECNKKVLQLIKSGLNEFKIEFNQSILGEEPECWEFESIGVKAVDFGRAFVFNTPEHAGPELEPRKTVVELTYKSLKLNGETL